MYWSQGTARNQPKNTHSFGHRPKAVILKCFQVLDQVSKNIFNDKNNSKINQILASFTETVLVFLHFAWNGWFTGPHPRWVGFSGPLELFRALWWSFQKVPCVYTSMDLEIRTNGSSVCWILLLSKIFASENTDGRSCSCTWFRLVHERNQQMNEEIYHYIDQNRDFKH